MKKICVVTGSRADYGLLKNILKEINRSSSLCLQLLVTGAHLSKKFGYTKKAIDDDGFQVMATVEMLLNSDTPEGILKSMGTGLIGFADALKKLNPDLLLIVGDRYEILVAASAALIAAIPIAHIHGGEITEEAFDDSIRHSITKMANIHFVAAAEYRKRVIQLGEQPNTVFNVGGLGVDLIASTDTLSNKEIEKALNFRLSKRNLLITFHPVTRSNEPDILQFDQLLVSLQQLTNTSLIFTMPNADNNNQLFTKRIIEFCSNRPNAKFYKALGQQLYFSCLKNFDGVVGNSSSGILEAPSFQQGTINIGNRQNGRLMASSVINCVASASEITTSLKKLFSKDFRNSLKYTINPYGDPGASKKIVNYLEKLDIKTCLKKKFFDLNL